MKNVILGAGLIMSIIAGGGLLSLAAISTEAEADTMQSDVSGVVSCRTEQEPMAVGGIRMVDAPFTNFAIGDGYYRMRMAKNNKLYLLPIANCYISLN